MKRKKRRKKLLGPTNNWKSLASKMKGLRSKIRKMSADPQWDLDRDGITFSAISKFLGCPHRFHLQYVQGWVSKKIAIPLEFGNLFHLYKQDHTPGEDVEPLLKIGMKYVRHRVEEKRLDAETEEELYRLAAVVHVTFRQYAKYWEKRASIEWQDRHYHEKNFHWIEKEKTFLIHYRMPDGRIVKLTGKQDGAFQLDKQTRGNWVLENKTKGDIDQDGIRLGLVKDLQTGIYLTARQSMDNVCPRGFLYNVIRRTKLSPRKNEKAKAFAERVEADIVKRPEWYFMRWSVEITPQDLVDFQVQNLNPILFRICRWWDSIKRNPMDPFHTVDEQGDKVSNLEHYARPFGVYDDMAHNVRGSHFEIIMSNNYFLYEKKKHAFPELVEDDFEKFLRTNKDESQENGKKVRLRFKVKDSRRDVPWKE